MRKGSGKSKETRIDGNKYKVNWNNKGSEKEKKKTEVKNEIEVEKLRKQKGKWNKKRSKTKTEMRKLIKRKTLKGKQKERI